MSRKRGKRSKGRSRGRAQPQQARGPRLTTPEGDPLVLARALYRHEAAEEIRRLLEAAADFGLDEDVEPASDGAIRFPWFETEPLVGDAPAMPVGQRVLAEITLGPAILEIETFSRRRRRACRQRLTELLGDRIELLGMETKSLADAQQEMRPAPPQEPVELPPEAIAQINEQIVRQWIDESIPALGGLTPRAAARTPEGRRRLVALLDQFDRDRREHPMPPGMFTPDYNVVRKILGLE